MSDRMVLVRRFTVAVLMLALGLLVPAGGAGAQRSPAGATTDRAAMERQLQERLFSIVQRELRLNPQQAERLRVVSSRTDQRRRALLDQERTLRQQLRGELADDRRADDGRITRLLDGLFAVQRERLDLVQSEQRDLARFLSPVQRARYLSLQENWRRRVTELETRDRRGEGEQHRGRRTPGAASGGRPPGGEAGA